MSDYDFDLFVVGAGSGGVRAARVASGYGAKVAIAEESQVGGTCVIRGCVPKKLLVYGAHFAEDFEDASAYGWTLPGEPSFSWKTLIANKDAEIERLNGIYKSLLKGSNVELFESRAVLKDAHTLEVGDKTVTAERILIAVGGTPVMPDIPGIEHAISSNQAFHLEDLPERIAVVGGGYIAVEFAGIFAGLGANVTQFYRGDQILRGFDNDIRNHLAEEIVKKGIDLRLHTNVTAISKNDDGSLKLTLTGGDHQDVDAIMFATGREPKTHGLGLEQAGVELNDRSAIITNAGLQTSVPNIYAVGDVRDHVQLTPVAIKEGMAFADTVYGGKPWSMSYQAIPTAVFSQPPVGTVGLSEEEARAKGLDVAIYKSTFKPMRHTLSGRDEKTLMKLIVDKTTDVVLGAHMVGPDAAEIIQGIGIAVRMGATKAQFDQTVAVHPSAAEEFVTMRFPVSD
ncbi:MULTISPECIES: glutathione-disulfide reductase [Thalassospira]|jgi:glutathione reductase (NADPH)|uniref:glutathione-disulfide reductase n=1 Tax=Thalassospira TaxID=168934 RepID=UPI001B184468|nr:MULTISPECIES: glutathione-disulfide reductase [Thalassospira]MBO6809339.1 glutathione-disulfide reductase [Thalassospira sp.]MBO6841926.1 glutathione-disulfide reductase [Thalassospira sp.]MBS8275523.1 glutathione-disulfide reductase [Thalassospira tepidiphila]